MTDEKKETERIRLIYDRRSAGERSRSGGADLRWLCSQAYGETLEVGIGRGRTLPFYPSSVHLSAIELSEVALETRGGEPATGGSGTTCGSASLDAPLPRRPFRHGVLRVVLCTIPDDRAAIAEAVRVLRPLGRIGWSSTCAARGS